METEFLRTTEITTFVSNLPESLGFTNTVSIYLDEDIEELIEDRRGRLLSLGSNMAPLQTNPHIYLLPHSLRPNHLFQLINDQDVPDSRYIGLNVALNINELLLNDNSLREPVFVSVNVKYIKERRRLVSSRVVVSAPLLLSSRGGGASGEVFQRLVEEQRVVSTDLEDAEDESCSICMEKLSENNIIRMPRCLHMFHQDCLFEWLGRQNSCPMCRRVPYEEDHGTETQNLAFGS